MKQKKNYLMLSKLTKSKCINYREVFVSWRGSELRTRPKVSYGLYQKSAMEFIKSKPKRRGGGAFIVPEQQRGDHK